MENSPSPGNTMIRGAGCGGLAGCVVGSLPLLALAGLFVWILIWTSYQNSPMGFEGEQIVGLMYVLPPLWLFAVGGGLAIGLAVGFVVALIVLKTEERPEVAGRPGPWLEKPARLSSAAGLALSLPIFVLLFLVSVLAFPESTLDTRIILLASIVLAPVATWTLVAYLIARYILRRYRNSGRSGERWLPAN